MKKVSIILMLLSCIIYTNLSFGKEPDKRESAKQLNLIYNWTVSSYGFLIFPTGHDVDSFTTLMQTKTHSEAQTYLSSIGFSSLGATLYTDVYADQMVTSNQAINYTLNTSRVIQVHGIIIKPVGQSECEDVKWEFVLAMSTANLSTESYYSFSRGIYDGSVMNKYATNPPASDTLSLTQKMSQSDAGYHATDPNPCPETLADRRPFWGWSQATCTVTGTVFNPNTNTSYPSYTYCAPSYYVFWVNVNNGGCWVVGTTCPPPLD